MNVDPKAILALVAMAAGFAAVYVPFRNRLPIAWSLLASCAAGTLAAGFGLPARHFVEGEFGYFYIVTVILTATIFLKVIQENGCLEGIVKALARSLSRFPVLLLFVGMGLLYLPGMVTGLGVPGAVGVGAILAPLFLSCGLSKASTAAFITLGAMLGSVTGPINIPAMIIAGGVNMPFEGFGRILPAITVPLGILSVVLLGLRPALKASPNAIVREFQARPGDLHGFRMSLPVLVVAALMLAIRLAPRLVPDLGTPLVFAFGTGVAVFCGRKLDVWRTVLGAVDGPVFDTAALLLAAGVFVQVATLNGVRGLLVIASLSLPAALIHVAAGVTLPVLGGTLTMLGAAAILGVPFATALLGHNPIIVVAALSVLCAISQYVPPTAIVGLLASHLVGALDYRTVLRRLAIPTGVAVVLCIAVLLFANQVALVLAG